jgi:hypothetical protein
MRLRSHRLFILFFISGLVFFSCKTEYGILYKIFNYSFKSYTPLNNRSNFIDSNLIGSYILDKEVALIIEHADTSSYSVTILPSYLTDQKKTLSAFVSEFKGNKYLSLRSPDYHYLIFKLEYRSDTMLLSELTSKVNKLFNERTTVDIIQKGGQLPDSVFLKIPIKKVGNATAIEFAKNQLQPQVRDIQSYYKYAAIFPSDTLLNKIRETAIKKMLASYSSVEKLKQLTAKYPELSPDVKIRSKQLCYSTKNCIDFIKFYPNELNQDSLIDKAFEFASGHDDYSLLINEFPNNSKSAKMFLNLYFSSKSKKNYNRVKNELVEKYAANKTFMAVTEAIKIIDRIPDDILKFNLHSYSITKGGHEMLERICFTLQDLNKDRNVLNDIYVLVQCREFSEEISKKEIINFRMAVNRAISLRKLISEYKFNGLNIHFIPVSKAIYESDSSSSFVRFTLDPFEADRFSKRFVKQCFQFRGIIIPSVKGEFITGDYIEEPELENFCYENLKRKLDQNPKAEIKILPCHFVDEISSNGNQDYQRVYTRFFSLFLDGKLRKREPEEFMIPLE